MKGTEQADSLTEALTGSLGSGLFGRLAWLARPDGVAGQDPKLILHPGTQVYYRSRQLPASDGLRNWQKKQKHNGMIITFLLTQLLSPAQLSATLQRH